MLVTGGPPVRGGGGMPFEIVGMSLATALITASVLVVLAIYFSAALQGGSDVLYDRVCT